jgi:CheY-like chemotaxis protein
MLSLAPTVSAGTCNASSPYVLLVDDHEPSLRQLHEVVRLHGHRCVSTCSPGDAVRFCDSRRPQVVLTDLAMPNLDGQALARWLRSRFPSLPIILMTGQELDAATRRTLQRTFTAILPKPLDIEALLSVLDRLMPVHPNWRAAPTRP